MIVLRLITRIFVVVGLTALVAILLLGAVAATHEGQTENQTTAAPTTVTRAAMRGIFTAFTSVYSYSLNMDYFSDKHNRETVTAALEALVANTSELRNHGGGLGPSFHYLEECLASDAEEAL